MYLYPDKSLAFLLFRISFLSNTGSPAQFLPGLYAIYDFWSPHSYWVRTRFQLHNFLQFMWVQNACPWKRSSTGAVTTLDPKIILNWLTQPSWKLEFWQERIVLFKWIQLWTSTNYSQPDTIQLDTMNYVSNLLYCQGVRFVLKVKLDPNIVLLLVFTSELNFHESHSKRSRQFSISHFDFCHNFLKRETHLQKERGLMMHVLLMNT